MARGKRDNSHLGDSWVINESSDDDHNENSNYKEEDDDEIDITPTSRKSKNGSAGYSARGATPRRRTSRAARESSKESDFIMPSIHEDGSTGSWTKMGGSRSEKVRDSPRKSKPQSRGTPLRGEGEHDTNPEQNDQSRRSRVLARKPSSRPGDSGSDFMDGLLDFVKEVVVYILDIVAGALKALKKPISVAIAAYLFFGLLILVRNLLTNSIYSALSPICRIPGASLMGLPMCQFGDTVEYQENANAAVEFDQLMTVQSKFEEILEQSAAGVSLPLDMKRGETSIRDLRQIVRFSHLSSRNELVLEFDGFIETARIASYDLQKFNSHVGRAVDNVLSTARWTRRVLEEISVREASRGIIPAFINDRLLAPFQPVNKFSENVLLDQYIQHTRNVEEQINHLISEAQALLLVLTNLEDRLEVIHSISMRDNVQAQGSKDEILSQLWTMLGGNRVALGKYNSQLQLLRRVGEYRKTAWAHISGTILRLQAMGAELEELRERVGSAELLKDRKEIPLAVHIENIELGVERLEQGRGNARRLENEHLRRVLDKGIEAEDARLVEG
ncbi:hypothetical protein UCRPC4_g01210 [Phaeomoniella chlamydospora]|uniref:Uncharacterized protein n=1 Tax=Phaeomoniella chlamydospora TaxID=158046 RepID=A0A0G2EX68_PHACM|nr:hypothetical protein UCRPC4_g01210 [Phaeomoniella chlamydospora]